MPCTAKKFEHGGLKWPGGTPDVDAVLTTVNWRVDSIVPSGYNSLTPDVADSPFGTRSSAGKLFGATRRDGSGRSVGVLSDTGKELENLKIKELRGLKGVKEATVKIGDLDVNVAVASGLANARPWWKKSEPVARIYILSK